MKNKIGICLSIFILVALLFPLTVNAESFDVNLTGIKTAAIGEKIDLTISLKSTSEMQELETNLKYDNNILELVSISKEDSWTGNNALQSNGNNNLKFSNKGITGESNIAVLRFKVKSSEKSTTTVTLDEIKVKINDENEESSTVLTHDKIKKDITIKSDDNTLKNIKIDDKAISGFNSSTYNYNIEVDSQVELVKINATLNDEKKSSFVDDFGPREVELDYGKNEVLLKVKSESENIATYKLNIIRKDDRVANTDLKSIIINGGKNKINFDKNVLSYTVKTFKLETIDIIAEPDDSTSTVKIDAPSKLIIGENKVRITVTAVTGDKKEYNLLIVNGEVETDTRLKNLSIKGINIDFNSDKYEYRIRYNKKYKNGLSIIKTTLSPDTEVEVIGNTNLKNDSVIKIIVTALDGSGSSEYKIILEKDKRINFFLILDLVISVVLIILIIIQVKKRKKAKKELIEKEKEAELEKTKEIVL